MITTRCAARATLAAPIASPLMPMSGCPAGAWRSVPQAIVWASLPDQPPIPPTYEDLESWAGHWRVLRAIETNVAAWRLPQSAKAALTLSGVPLLDEIVDRVSFHGAPTMYQLAFGFGAGPTDPAWEFGAVPVTGEVRLWPPGGQEVSSFVNSSIGQWLCSLHLVGSRFSESDLFDGWDESAEAEERALAELADLLGRIEAIDPAAIGDGNHERQFWPGLLDRWLFEGLFISAIPRSTRVLTASATACGRTSVS